MTYEDPNDAPKADRVQGFKCGHCEHLHIALMDEEDLCLATAVVTREMILGMLELIDESGPSSSH